MNLSQAYDTLYAPILDRLDAAKISPNRLVTIRTWVGIAVSTILAFNPEISENQIIDLVSKIWLAGIFTLSLIADRIDGDLARHTNQCSKDGEVLDAWADKVIVYWWIWVLLWLNFNSFSIEELTILWALFWINLTLDTISQLKRWLEANKDALSKFWKAPTTQEERDSYEYEKTGNGANMLWKLKTWSIMWALGLGVSQSILWYSDETLYALLTYGMWASAVLWMWSLELKKIKEKKAKNS